MSSTALNLSKGRARVVLSLTPLIDVVFILLVFFMLVSQFATWREVEMRPQASLDEQTTDLAPLVITVDANNTVTINGRPVADAPDAASEAARTLSEGQTVILRPLEGTAIQPVISLLEALTHEDITNVRIDKQGPNQ
ncbi:ExbD/TolR family protein [Pyruvatibacter sp.]|nr:biopolymer transporter ExbD [Alphaproteobacteria bacterium]